MPLPLACLVSSQQLDVSKETLTHTSQAQAIQDQQCHQHSSGTAVAAVEPRCMASTPRAEPRESAAPLSPAAAATKLQGKPTKKKQKHGTNGSSNNGSYTRGGMCEAPEARWPGSSTAATVVQPVRTIAGLMQPLAMSSRSSCDGERSMHGMHACMCCMLLRCYVAAWMVLQDLYSHHLFSQTTMCLFLSGTYDLCKHWVCQTCPLHAAI